MLPPEEPIDGSADDGGEQYDLHGYTLEELRRLVQEGIDSGPSIYASFADLKAEARRRFNIVREG